MASPVDSTAPFGVDRSSAKTFTVEEADGLLPAVEAIFHEMDHRQLRLRETNDLLQDLGSYWGGRLTDPECPDRDSYLRLLRERDELHASLEEDIRRIHALGAVLKDYTTGLIDFYGYVDGELVFLCWQRGESEIKFYHTLEGGFSGRRPLAPVAQK